ncbi:MAG TPA: PAS domain S-box protein [Gemmatimonadaceae bacterium]|nr:PAS domain S-box protein [Gemmatimonadaceae bacterium]
MADQSPPRRVSPLRPYDVDTVALLEALPAAHGEEVVQLVRERDNLFLLHHALLDAERARTLEGQLRVFVSAIARVGFGRVALVVRDAAMAPTLVVAAGLTDDEERLLGDDPAASGERWRRRLVDGEQEMERFRLGGTAYYLDGRDPYVVREFGRGAVRSELTGDASNDPEWSPRDVLLLPLRAGDGRLLATLTLDEPDDRRRPTLTRVRTVELFGRQVARFIEQAQLVTVATRRAERLQLLQEIGTSLARSLDERAIVSELARQVARVLPVHGVVVEHPDLDTGTTVRALRLVRSTEWEAGASAPTRLGAGPVATVARNGRSLRVADYDPARSALAAADDVVGEPAGPAGRSLIAVPMLVGRHLVGVLAAYADARDALSVEDEEVLRAIGAQAATALVNARLYADSERERRQSEALADVARAVGGSLRLNDVLQLTLRHATALLRVAGASISLRAGDELRIVAGAGAGDRLLGMRLPIEGSLSGRIVREGTYQIVNDTDADPESYGPTKHAAMIRRALMVPLVTGSGTVGVLSVFNRESPFVDADARVLQRLADHVAVAIVNAQLFEDVTAHHALAERHRQVLQAASDAIVITDRERRIAFANPAAAELWGASSEADLVRRPVSELTAAETVAEVAQREDRALAGEPQRYEATILRLDGERRIVSVTTAPLRERGEVTGVVASLRDVSDERRALDAVAHSEARYRNLFESAHDSIYTLDARGFFTSVNESTCCLIGVPREELLGRSIAPLMAPEDLERVTELFKAARAGEARRYECALVRPDGERRLISVTNTPIRRGSEAVGVLGIARDVTAERERETALQRSEARYTRLVESAPDGICTLDEAGRFTSLNRAFEQSVGAERGALLGARFIDFCDPRDRDATWQIFTATLHGARQRAEVRYRGPGGPADERWAQVLTTPVVEDGRPAGALAVVRDVTDEKRLTAQLLQQEKLAAIGQLVSGVAHELNNPLAGVMAFSQILAASPNVGEEERTSAETIVHEAQRAAKIVSNLLTFARQHHPERSETNVNDVLVDTLELRRYALRVAGVEITVNLDDRVPSTWADPFQLQQVLLNLIGNAEHALDEWDGPKRIMLTTSWGGSASDPIVITVADSGPGIPPEHAGRVFNPFFTTKPVGQGTGLGLSISHGIVREHGGRIRVESAVGAGATFQIELPVVDPPPPPVDGQM